MTRISHILIDRLIDFNGMSSNLGLTYAFWLENRVIVRLFFV